MSQIKTLRKVISELERYFKVYGDCPCYIAMGDNIVPLTNTAFGSATPEDDNGNEEPVSMNIIIFCDDKAYQVAQDESAITEALTDSTYDE